MPEIRYKAFEKYLQGSDSPQRAVYLFHGEAYLYRQAVDKLLSKLLPDGSQSASYDTLDGRNDHIPELLDKMTTFSMFGGGKVVHFADAQFFLVKQDQQQLFEKAMEAHAQEDADRAAGYMISLLGLAGLTPDTATEGNYQAFKPFMPNANADTSWLEPVLSLCREKRMTASAPGNGVEILEKAVEKGFPKGNVLIVTTETVDKRRRLYKLIAELGVIVDCAVPRGDRFADRKQQEALLREEAGELLVRHRKNMDAEAFALILDLIGFDLHVWRGSIEKLVHYAGKRDTITAADVRNVLKRTKSDPIYELTNALAERNSEKALFLIDSLLSDGFHALQILSAAANQIRKLLAVKSFVESARGRCWQAGMPYPRFQQRVVPEISAFEGELFAETECWGEILDASENTKAASARKRKKRIGTDLVLVKNPQNSYPIYQLFLKSDNFTLKHLIRTVLDLSQADVSLKTSSHQERILLERTVLKICGGLDVQNENHLHAGSRI